MAGFCTVAVTSVYVCVINALNVSIRVSPSQRFWNSSITITSVIYIHTNTHTYMHIQSIMLSHHMLYALLYSQDITYFWFGAPSISTNSVGFGLICTTNLAKL